MSNNKAPCLQARLQRQGALLLYICAKHICNPATAQHEIIREANYEFIHYE